MKRLPDILIFDWGIGGLAFFSAFKRRYPRVPVIYFSDSGMTPYGKLPGSDLKRRLNEIRNYFSTFGINKIVIACNAMSTVQLKDPYSVESHRLIGVIGPTAEYLNKKPFSTIAVVGGIRTIRSNSYKKLLRHKKVLQRIAQPLSGLIESGKQNTLKFDAVLDSIIKPLRFADCLILGCTHYSASTGAFQKRMPETVLIDPSLITLDWVAKNWTFHPNSSHDVFFTTGNVTAMKNAAYKAFGIKLGGIKRLPLGLKYL